MWYQTFCCKRIPARSWIDFLDYIMLLVHHIVRLCCLTESGVSPAPTPLGPDDRLFVHGIQYSLHYLYGILCVCCHRYHIISLKKVRKFACKHKTLV